MNNSSCFGISVYTSKPQSTDAAEHSHSGTFQRETFFVARRPFFGVITGEILDMNLLGTMAENETSETKLTNS